LESSVKKKILKTKKLTKSKIYDIIIIENEEGILKIIKMAAHALQCRKRGYYG